MLEAGIQLPVGKIISARKAHRGKRMPVVNALVNIEHTGPSKYGSHTHLLEEAICWNKFLALDTTLASWPPLKPGDYSKGGEPLGGLKRPASNRLFPDCAILRGESRVKMGMTDYKSL